MFGMYGSHDERRFLAFHETHGGVRTCGQQVLSEEALYQREVLSQQALANHSCMYPALIAITMAIGTILHDMTGTDALVLIDLPEDDLTTAGRPTAGCTFRRTTAKRCCVASGFVPYSPRATVQ